MQKLHLGPIYSQGVRYVGLESVAPVIFGTILFVLGDFLPLDEIGSWEECAYQKPCSANCWFWTQPRLGSGKLTYDVAEQLVAAFAAAVQSSFLSELSAEEKDGSSLDALSDYVADVDDDYAGYAALGVDGVAGVVVGVVAVADDADAASAVVDEEQLDVVACVDDDLVHHSLHNVTPFVAGVVFSQGGFVSSFAPPYDPAQAMEVAPHHHSLIVGHVVVVADVVGVVDVLDVADDAGEFVEHLCVVLDVVDVVVGHVVAAVDDAVFVAPEYCSLGDVGELLKHSASFHGKLFLLEEELKGEYLGGSLLDFSFDLGLADVVCEVVVRSYCAVLK